MYSSQMAIMHRLEDLVQIGEAAKIRGVSIDTLRRWERSGFPQSHVQRYLNKGRAKRSSTRVARICR
ncbi:MAG TPA: hypothetical protein DDW76_04365 [Cyanobacteria bacterium UBA11369]|nr:hypothetical protein [Cyanobacteria bacterium UBA11371]HBE32265.1 hypothetical protein [Cyanobacteria bacterium UBA11368]HBE48043.1 hypothetical protein [Cyanobacteria bacterium UBA11369]